MFNKGYMITCFMLKIHTLCVSAEILVTPGTRKSNGWICRSQSSAKATRNPPRQASTCNGIPNSSPSFAISTIGSIRPRDGTQVRTEPEKSG